MFACFLNCVNMLHIPSEVQYFKISVTESHKVPTRCVFSRNQNCWQKQIFIWRWRMKMIIYLNVLFFYTDYLYGSKTADGFKLNLAVRPSSFILTGLTSLLFFSPTALFDSIMCITCFLLPCCPGAYLNCVSFPYSVRPLWRWSGTQ